MTGRQGRARRWLGPVSDAPDSVRGGQPIPPPCLSAAHGGYLSPQGLPRWARCPVDGHVHLLSVGEVAAAGGEGHGRAACGRMIPAAGLTIEGPAERFRVGCVAVGTAR